MMSKKKKLLAVFFLLSSSFLFSKGWKESLRVSATDLVDFEFTSNESVKGFNAINGHVSKTNNSELKVDVTDSSLSLQSPEINVPRGNKYSALLSVRNTILLRIKNNTNATVLSVYYITSNEPNFSEEMKKDFEIKPNSEYESYYLNLSDTEQCNGYLRGFKLVFNNTNDGEIYIDAITFEREDALTNYLGKITSCIANKESKTVTIKGKIKDGYKGKEIKVLQSDSKNYNESLNYQDCVLLATTLVKENNEFEVTFSLMKNQNTTHLSSLFLLSIDGKKINKSCMIENYKDFSEVPTRFVIEEKVSVKVTEERFNAKGDSFTDDTNAIQQAIDYVSGVGGGKVILPGDETNPYGKRYMVTQINMKSNVEFVIEKGAVLWQSPRYEQYHYKDTTPIFGHESNIDNMMWCHACATINYPLLYAANCENIRITGGGTIRMMDNGVEETDSAKFLGDPGLNVACNSIIHVCPAFFYLSKNIDVTDINIKRSNGWHMPNQNCENVYYGNIIESEIGCVTSDGFSFSCAKDGYVERCMTYTSDDALVLSTKYKDGRGKWFHADIDGDNSTKNIMIRSSYLWGGFGVSFIPWGTGSSNLSNQIIENIDIQDCVLGGQKSVGVWSDDPFYGYSKYNTYNSTEADYTPIKNVHFNHNTYLNGFEMYLMNNRIPVTNLIVEDNDGYSTKSPSQFVLGDFDRNLRFGSNYDDESNFIAGLAYWSSIGDASTIKMDETYGYSGCIRGNGELYQGLFERSGFYRLSIKTMLKEGEAYLFARDALTKEILFQKPIEQSNQFIENIVEFNLDEDKTLQIGIAHIGSKDEAIYLDDANIKMIDDCHLLNLYFKEDFTNDSLLNLDIKENLIVDREEDRWLKLTSNFSFIGQYDNFDFLMGFVNENDTVITFTFTNEMKNQEHIDIDLHAYNDSKRHVLGVSISNNELTISIDYKKLSTYSLTIQGVFNIDIATNKEIMVDNVYVNSSNTLITLMEERFIDLSLPDDIKIFYTQKNEPLYDGDVVSFTLSNEKDLEVLLNGIALSKNENDEYSFIVCETNKLEIVRQPLKEPMPSKKGCKGTVSTSFNILLLLTATVLIKEKKRGERK